MPWDDGPFGARVWLHRRSLGRRVRGVRFPCAPRKVVIVSEKHHPTPEERDERVKLPLDPEMAIEAILGTGLHRDEDEPDGDDR